MENHELARDSTKKNTPNTSNMYIKTYSADLPKLVKRFEILLEKNLIGGP